MAQSAAVIALSATSKTDEYIFKKDSEFRPLIRQHSDFSQFHRVTKLPGINLYYYGYAVLQIAGGKATLIS
jgi:hypothetical protein